MSGRRARFEKWVNGGHDSGAPRTYSRRTARQANLRRQTVNVTAATAETARRELAPGFEGEVIGPSDARYDEARALYNAMFDKRPAVIARCTSAADVARAVGFAREHGMPLAIRGGAHNGAGLASVDDG